MVTGKVDVREAAAQLPDEAEKLEQPPAGTEEDLAGNEDGDDTESQPEEE